MFIQADLSLYALRTTDLSTPIDLLSKVFEGEDVKVYPGAMSTIVAGERDVVFRVLQKAFEKVSDTYEVVLMVKISNACPQAEGGICQI